MPLMAQQHGDVSIYPENNSKASSASAPRQVIVLKPFLWTTSCAIKPVFKSSDLMPLELSHDPRGGGRFRMWPITEAQSLQPTLQRMGLKVPCSEVLHALPQTAPPPYSHCF